MTVPESRVVCVFGRKDECSEEDAVKGPFSRLDGEVRYRTADVDQGHQHGRGVDVRGMKDLCDEICEIGTLF